MKRSTENSAMPQLDIEEAEVEETPIMFMPVQLLVEGEKEVLKVAEEKAIITKGLFKEQIREDQ